MRSTTLFVCFLAFGFALATQPGIRLGKIDPNFQPYIIQGEEAEDGKYPYMLSLNYNSSKTHACGASILTKNYALTAAHCCQVMEGVGLYLHAGSNHATKGGSEHEIEKYEIHPRYSPPHNWIYDACIMKVKEPFVFNDRVAQITLPPLRWPVNDGDRLNVTGWGYTKPGGPDSPEKLQLGKNFIALSNEKCKKLTGQRHRSYLCVLGGKNGQGVCNGDSGSPIVKDQVQVGIASWVIMPCGGGNPDFYCRVPEIVDWIKKAVGDDAKDLKFHNPAL